MNTAREHWYAVYRALRTRSMSTSLSCVGELFFVEPKIKLNGQYYRTSTILYLNKCQLLSNTSQMTIMVALCNRAGRYSFALGFLSSIFFFFPSFNLSGRRLDVYHTSTHGAALVRIQNACLKCCTRLAENTGRKKSPCWQHRTTLSGYIFAAKACMDNRKTVLNINTSSTRPHNMVNLGLQTPEICRRV